MNRNSVARLFGASAVAALVGSGPPAIGATEEPAVRVQELSPAGELKPDPSGLGRPASFWVSRDGHRWAYAAARGSRVMMVVDGRELGPYSSIGPVDFHVPGEAALEDYQRTRHGAFTPDGELFIFTAARSGKYHLIVVDKHGASEGPPLDRITAVFMPPAGHRYAAVHYATTRQGLDNAAMGGNIQLLVDGKDSPHFAHLHDESITFTTDGRHIAFLGQRKLPTQGTSSLRQNVYNVFIDGAPGPNQDNVFSTGQIDVPIRLMETDQGPVAIYVAKNGAERSGHVVLQRADGSVESGPADMVWNSGAGSNIVVSADRRHWACYTQREQQGLQRQFTVYLDGREYASHQGAYIKNFTLDPTGKRLAYVFNDGNITRPVVDGKAGPDYKRIEQITFSPDGQRVAYIATAASGGTFVVLDGREYGSYSADRLQFSPDGKHAVWVASDANHRVHLALDGKLGPAVMLARNAWIGFQPIDGALVYVTGREDGEGRSQDKVVYLGLEGAVRYPAASDPQLTPDGKHLAFVGRHWELNSGRGRTTEKEPPFFVYDGRRVELPRPIQGAREYLFDPAGRFVAAFVGRPVLFNSVGQDGLSINGVPVMNLTWVGGPLHLYDDDRVAAIGGNSEGRLLRVTADAEQVADHGETLAAVGRSAAEPDAITEQSILHTFTNQRRSGIPAKGALIVREDQIYGVAAGGEYGQGVVYRISTDGTNYQEIHSFAGGANHPRDPMSILRSSDDWLYGTASGPRQNTSVIFRVRPDGKDFEIVKRLAETPLYLCAAGNDGSVYGYTYGNAGGYGDLSKHFRMGSNGEWSLLAVDMEPKLAQRQNSAAAGEKSVIGPMGPFINGGDGYFYGTGLSGIWRMRPDGSERKLLHTFDGPPLDGHIVGLSTANAPLQMEDGRLAGYLDGGKHGAGVIYRIARDGTDYEIRHIQKTKGMQPEILPPLTVAGNAIYGLGKRYDEKTRKTRPTLARFEGGTIEHVDDLKFYPDENKSLQVGPEGTRLYGVTGKNLFRVPVASAVSSSATAVTKSAPVLARKVVAYQKPAHPWPVDTIAYGTYGDSMQSGAVEPHSLGAGAPTGESKPVAGTPPSQLPDPKAPPAQSPQPSNEPGALEKTVEKVKEVRSIFKGLFGR